MHEFVKTNDSQNIPYIIIYIAYGSTAIIEQRCWLESPDRPYHPLLSPRVGNHGDLLEDIYFANERKLGLIVFVEAWEIVLDVYTFLNMRHQASTSYLSFINAGLTIGKGVVNAIFYIFFVTLSIVKYFEDDSDSLL